MSRKRTLLPDVYKQRKRLCVDPTTPSTNSASWTNDHADGLDNCNNVPSDTKAALLYLKGLFPREKFEGRVPPIMLKHQLYSILKNRTMVDKEVADLRTHGEIRLFKLGSEANEFCIVFTDDYRQHILNAATQVSVSRTIIEKFLATVVSECADISVNKQTMMRQFSFKDEEITQLVKASVLTVRDVGSWWLAIPGAGIFMKSFIRGRKAVLTVIRKSKYKEILQRELESRKLPKVARLGMMYHIHDIIGADLVDCTQTTSGKLLRLSE